MNIYEIASQVRNRLKLHTEKELPTPELVRHINQASYDLSNKLYPFFKKDLYKEKEYLNHSGLVEIPSDLLLLSSIYRKNTAGNYKLCHELEMTEKPLIGTVNFPQSENYPLLIQQSKKYEIYPEPDGNDVKVEYRKRIAPLAFGVGAIDENYVFEINSTLERGQNNQLSFQPIVGPALYYFEGTYRRTYMTWAQRDGAGYSIEPMAQYYDHDTEEWSAAVGWDPAREGAQDEHGSPAIIVADNGNVIIAHENLSGTNPSDHNSPMHIKVSDNPEDISSYTEIAQGTIDDYLCYPKFWKLSDGTLFLAARYGPISTNMDEIRVYKSEDNGLTWANAFDSGASAILLQLDTGGSNYWAYNLRLPSKDSRGMHLIVNALDYSASSGYPISYYLYSEDGETWYNIDRSYSKNISTSGNLDATEMNTYFQVDYSATGSDIRYTAGGGFSPSGNLYLLQWYGTRSPSTSITAHYLMYFQGGAWVKKQISGIFAVSAGFYLDAAYTLIPHTDNIIDMYCTRLVSGKYEIEVYRTEDRGDNWSLLKAYTSGSDYDHEFVKITENWEDSPFLIIASSYEVNANWEDLYLRVVSRETQALQFDNFAPIQDDIFNQYDVHLYEEQNEGHVLKTIQRIEDYYGAQRKAIIPISDTSPKEYDIADNFIYALDSIIPQEFSNLLTETAIYFLAISGYTDKDPDRIIGEVDKKISLIYEMNGLDYKLEGKK